MKRVINISLNGNPYSIEEDAYETLRVYLAEATVALAEDPDRSEILADLEQAIADRCRARLAAARTVISAAELDPTLAEVGQVAPAKASGDSSTRASPTPLPRFEQISEGAWISGVCVGIGHYFAFSAAWVRFAMIVLALFSGGAMIAAYLVLMVLMPYAPLAEKGPAVRTIPLRVRGFTERLRLRMSALLS
jgi:phage shock protein PspC (stress-responsive transcriptional regulator)